MSEFYPKPDKDQIEAIFEGAVSRRLITPKSKELVIANLDMTFVPQVMGGALPSTFSGAPLLLMINLDETGSVSGYRDRVIKLLKEQLTPSLVKIQNKQAVDILMAVAGFNTMPHLILPFTRVDLIDTDVFDQKYHPNGSTALYDAHWAAITGLLGYGYTLYGDNVRGSRKIYALITDGEENASKKNPDGSFISSPANSAAFMADTRRERVNSFGFMGLSSSRTFRSEATSLGFLGNNVVEVKGATDTALAKALELIQKSSELVSAQLGKGQPVSVQSTANSGDDMFFTVGGPIDPLANI
jgi:hypothetical protein